MNCLTGMDNRKYNLFNNIFTRRNYIISNTFEWLSRLLLIVILSWEYSIRVSDIQLFECKQFEDVVVDKQFGNQ